MRNEITIKKDLSIILAAVHTVTHRERERERERSREKRTSCRCDTRSSHNICLGRPLLIPLPLQLVFFIRKREPKKLWMLSFHFLQIGLQRAWDALVIGTDEKHTPSRHPLLLLLSFFFSRSCVCVCVFKRENALTVYICTVGWDEERRRRWRQWRWRLRDEGQGKHSDTHKHSSTTQTIRRVWT